MTNCHSKYTESEERTVVDLEFDGLFTYLDIHLKKTEQAYDELVKAEKVSPRIFPIMSTLFNAWRDGEFERDISIRFETFGGAEKTFAEINGFNSQLSDCLASLCPSPKMFIKLFGLNKKQHIVEMYGAKVKLVVFFGTTRMAQQRQRDTEWKCNTFAPVNVIIGGATHNCRTCKKEGDNMTKCGGCHAYRYCSRECQKDHWKIHKTDCLSMKVSALTSWVNALSIKD